MSSLLAATLACRSQVDVAELIARVADLTLSVQAQSQRQEEASRAQQEATLLFQLRAEFAEALAAAVRAAPPIDAHKWFSHISAAEFYKTVQPIPCDSDFLRVVALPDGLLRGRPLPEDAEVAVVQPWFLGMLSRLLRAAAPAFRVIQTGGSTKPLGEAIGDIRPDQLIVPAAAVGRPLTDETVPISAVVEIKKGAAANFAQEEMGQALSYGHRVVAKRHLSRLLVVLANTTNLQLWELATTPSQPGRVLIFDFGVMPLEDGLSRLAAGLPLSSVLALGEASADVLGRGATSVVFGLADRPGCVAKVVYLDKPDYLASHMVDREREALVALRDVAHIVRLDEAPATTGAMPLLAARTLVLSPRGTPLRPVDVLERPALMADLIHALRHAHAAGFVHCDLRFSNLYLDGDGALAIADWGFAFKAGEPPRPWLGTVVTASVRVLLALPHGDQLTPQPADDLESCVKLARLATLARYNPVAADDVATAAAARGYRAVCRFWEWQLAEPAWARALDHAQKRDYDALTAWLAAQLTTPGQ